MGHSVCKHTPGGKPFVACVRLRTLPQYGESPYIVRSARGELENSPVDCFLRGEALQERASLSCSHIFFAAFSQRTQRKVKSFYVSPSNF